MSPDNYVGKLHARYSPERSKPPTPKQISEFIEQARAANAVCEDSLQLLNPHLSDEILKKCNGNLNLVTLKKGINQLIQVLGQESLQYLFPNCIRKNGRIRLKKVKANMVNKRRFEPQI